MRQSGLSAEGAPHASCPPRGSRAPLSSGGRDQGRPGVSPACSRGSWEGTAPSSGLPSSLLPSLPNSWLPPSLPATQLFCQHCCLIIFQVASWSRCSNSFLHRKQTGAVLSFALLGKIPLLLQILLERFRDFCEVSPGCSSPGISLQMDDRGSSGLPRCGGVQGPSGAPLRGMGWRSAFVDRSKFRPAGERG